VTEVAEGSNFSGRLWNTKPRIHAELPSGSRSLTRFNLLQLRQAERQLAATVLCDLHRGNAAAATANLRAMLALVKGPTDERLVISQLVRSAIAAGAVGLTWELLQSPGVTDTQLAVLQNDWAELDFLQAMENALSMHRAMAK